MNLCYFRVIIFIKFFVFCIYKSCQIKVINNKYRENYRKIRRIEPLKLWDIAEKTKKFKKALVNEKIQKEKEQIMKEVNIEGKL